MTTILIGLGSNLGDRPTHIRHAMKAIDQSIGTISGSSSIYETSAWGKNAAGSPAYLNAVLQSDTSQSAQEVLTNLLWIEEQLGRVRGEINAPRTIDLDLLFFGDHVHSTPDLEVPHPQISDRMFVLLPLLELVPNFIHPKLGLSIHKLLRLCKDPLPVTYFGRLNT